ncbi:MAG: hypothetical protein SFW65_00410 [Alphaproteobacteria bacterium]|nr:hypothetical protein [Alphaproteobacteria bacterium]
MADVVRLKHFRKNPEHDWNELRPRIVQRQLGSADFSEIMQSPLLVAAILVDRQTIEVGDKLYGEHSTHHYRSYELIYRDDVTGKLEQRRIDNVDEELAGRVFEQRLDLVRHEEAHINMDLVARIYPHNSKTTIVPRFDDGAHADARFIIPNNTNLLRFYLMQLGFGFDNSVINKRPAEPPRRKTRAEQYAELIAHANAPQYTTEW